MRKTVFLFPGQGSQEVGMARDLFRDDEYFNSLVAEASKITKMDLSKLCLKGPEKELAFARFLQPLLVAVSLGYLRHIRERNIPADFVLGHSLGEITALAAAGVITDTTAIAIAAKRGELMDEAAAAYPGGMMAVMGIDVGIVHRAIRESGLLAKVFIANINAPDQTVVSGDSSAFDVLSKNISKAGGSSKRLNVSGPWHSPYMEEAYEKFQEWVAPLGFQEPRLPVLFNATAKFEPDPVNIKELIGLQLSGPVYFKQCMDFCRSEKVDTFLEIGPGRVLSGLVRANGCMQGVSIYNINNLKGVETAAADLTAA